MQENNEEITLGMFVEYMSIVRDVLKVSLDEGDLDAVGEIVEGLDSVLETFLEGEDIDEK